MGMPVMVEIDDKEAAPELFEAVFSYFTYVDETFSTYKETSEISAINRGEFSPDAGSKDMKLVFALSEETKKLTNGYFDIATGDGTYDPSGLVKGWAIFNAAQLLKARGVKNFYVEAGGDIEVSGKNANGEPWRISIEHPFRQHEAKKAIIKTVVLNDKGIATSGIYKRGAHIYDPIRKSTPAGDVVVSLTVIGPNVYEADRFATAAFAMGQAGILFIELLSGFEGYQINRDGIATMTSGFHRYIFESHA